MRRSISLCTPLVALAFLIGPLPGTLFADLLAPGSERPVDSGPVNFDASSSQWPQPGGLGTAVYVTYSYSNLLDGALGIDPVQLRAATEEALGLWATYAPLHFTEIVDVGPTPFDPPPGSFPERVAGEGDIRIGHHAIPPDILGNDVLAHAWFPFGTNYALAGDLHFDDTNAWSIGGGSGSFDLLQVLVHELGHSLGLDHEETIEAIMNPVYVPGRYPGLGGSFLLPDDIAGIRSIYGEGTGSVTSIPEFSPPIFGFLLSVFGITYTWWRRKSRG